MSAGEVVLFICIGIEIGVVIGVCFGVFVLKSRLTQLAEETSRILAEEIYDQQEACDKCVYSEKCKGMEQSKQFETITKEDCIKGMIAYARERAGRYKR